MSSTFGVYRVIAIVPGGKQYSLGWLFGDLDMCVYGAWHHWKLGSMIEGNQPTPAEIEAPETVIQFTRGQACPNPMMQ